MKSSYGSLDRLLTRKCGRDSTRQVWSSWILYDATHRDGDRRRCQLLVSASPAALASPRICATFFGSYLGRSMDGVDCAMVSLPRSREERK